MREQQELTWYLGAGQSVFERSTIGAILDKLELESCTSRTCRVCKGEGIVDEPHECRDPKDSARTITVQFGAWCRKCKGIGVEPVFLSSDEQRLAATGDWSRGDTDGARCAVPDATLIRYAFVSRMLSRMPLEAREVIEAAYGDAGEELSRTLKGREWAVMPLTEAGRELLRSERDRKATVGVTEPERPVWCLCSLADLPKSERHPERTILLDAAREQAVKMLREAEATWDLIVGGLSEREAAK